MSINISNVFSYQTETTTHQSRVVADGGTVSNIIDVDNKILINKERNIQQWLIFGCDPNYGMKTTTGLIDKIYDYSAFACDSAMTLTGRPSVVTGRVGRNAVSFNGTSTRILTTAATTIASTNNAISFSGWLNVNSTSTSINTIFCIGAQGAPYLWVYRPSTGSSSLTVQYWNGSINSNIGIANALPTTFDDTWVHLGFSMDFTAKIARVYINGNLQVTSGVLTTPQFPSATNVKSFGMYAGTGNFFKGMMMQTSLYNTLLTAADFQRLMNDI